MMIRLCGSIIRRGLLALFGLNIAGALAALWLGDVEALGRFAIGSCAAAATRGVLDVFAAL